MGKVTSKAKIIISVVILLVVTIVALFPFYMMFIMSTYKTSELAQVVTMLPGGYFLENLKRIFEGGFLNYYFNSFYIAILGTAGCVLLSSLTGYGFAKFKFKLNKPLLFFIIICMMIPMQLSLVGYVIEMRQFGLVNKREAVIFMSFANCFSVFWMTQTIKSNVPDSVLESARLDGCSELGIFFKIVLAYIKPGIATITILQFMWNWNSYLLPLVVLNDPKYYPVTLGIASLSSRYSADVAAQITALSLGTLPLVLLFIFGSKYFIRGLTAGDVKE